MKLKIIITALMIAMMLTGGSALAADPLFDKLQRQLVSEGYDPERIAGFYNDKRNTFAEGMVISFFKHDESKLDYKQFESAEDIANCRQYLANYKAAFDYAETVYGVPREVVTAIILVESRLGRHLGKSRAFNVLSTMAALQFDDVRQKFYIMAENERRLPREQFMDRAVKRSTWAYKELKALIDYAEIYGFDPYYFTSSYAGAIGYCQFMPSNILPYGVDGNGDGVIDLFTHEDAICSVASYLNKNGWSGAGISVEQQRKAVHRYNHSNYYVDCILAVAAKMK